MDKYDAIEEMASQFGTSEFVAVLNYYKIKNDGKSKMVCPFHNDKDYGNATFGWRPGRGRCFNCGAKFGVIDLVELYEPQLSSYYEKVRFVHETILGRPVPEFTKGKYNNFLSKKELDTIQLFHGLGGYIKTPVSMCERMDRSSTLERGAPDDEDIVTLYSKTRVDSIYDMYKESPESALQIILNKIDETIDACNAKLEITYDTETEMGKICSESPETAEKIRKALKSHIFKTEEIRKKIPILSKKAIDDCYKKLKSSYNSYTEMGKKCSENTLEAEKMRLELKEQIDELKKIRNKAKEQIKAGCM